MMPMKCSPKWLARIWSAEGWLGAGPDAGPLATSTALMNRLSVAPSYVTARWLQAFAGRGVAAQTVALAREQIGRASRRERVQISVVAVSLKKKRTEGRRDRAQAGAT